jgi:hypothetical protein
MVTMPEFPINVYFQSKVITASSGDVQYRRVRLSAAEHGPTSGKTHKTFWAL